VVEIEAQIRIPSPFRRPATRPRSLRTWT
jgi:hypothetical protein